jgi:SAM-dependent methyltransferase
MKRSLLRILRCPDCGAELRVQRAAERLGEIEEGELVCTGCGSPYPIAGFIPRFAPRDNYTSSFGFQWNEFRRTQLDSYSGQPITRRRFFAQSAWTADDLSGRLVLDLGCGAGRFAEISLSTGAEIVAVDYSNAVDACWLNLGSNPRLHVVQADVYRLPFEKRCFDYVYCFGVMQHTPDVERTFVALSEQVSAGGRLAVDVYPRLRANALWPKYWLRPITRRVPPPTLFRVVQGVVPLLFPVSLAIGRIPGVGRRLRYAIPVANYDGVLPLTSTQLREWAVLDTFDMLSPAHDHPQSVATLRSWFDRVGFEQVEVFRLGMVVGRGRRPAIAASEVMLPAEGQVSAGRAR